MSVMDDLTGEIAPILTLTDAERDALAQELRRYADYRQDYSVYHPSEAWAELASDPTYASQPTEVWDQVTARQERQHQNVQGSNLAAADMFEDLARHVEEHQVLPLTRDTVRLLSEVFDNAGWGRASGDSPPAGLKRAVDRVHAMESRSAGRIAVPVWDDVGKQAAAPVWETVNASTRGLGQIEQHVARSSRHEPAPPTP